MATFGLRVRFVFNLYPGVSIVLVNAKLAFGNSSFQITGTNLVFSSIVGFRMRGGSLSAFCPRVSAVVESLAVNSVVLS
jgi:hypothetical protein